MNLKKIEWYGKMSKLQEYVEKIKQYVQQHPDMSELEIIRYVYLDLGKRFSFNLNFMFGNSKTKKQIYSDSKTLYDLDESMESNIIICKSLAYILKYVLKELGTNIIAVTCANDDKTCPHVYNVINLKSGRSFSVDLQNDLPNIQSHSFTTFFGLESEFESEKRVIPRFEIEQIDRKIGYISSENYYSDDYLYLLKSDIGYFESLPEKVKFVLENIDIHENKEMGYFERKRHHENMLKELFSHREMADIHIIDCYQTNGEEKNYKNCIAVDKKKDGIDIYIYSTNECKYEAISLEQFLKLTDGVLKNSSQFPRLNQMIKDFKKTKDER